jgi:hypothetical protein
MPRSEPARVCTRKVSIELGLTSARPAKAYPVVVGGRVVRAGLRAPASRSDRATVDQLSAARTRSPSAVSLSTGSLE